MSSRPSSGGALDRIVRRFGQIRRVGTIGTPAPAQQLGTEQPPRPPAQEPAPSKGRAVDSFIDTPAVPPTAEAASALGLEPPPGPRPESPMATPPPVVPSATDVANTFLSPAQKYYRDKGMMPNYISLQVMTTRQQLETELGRIPTKNELIERLTRRFEGSDQGLPAV